MTIAHTHRNRGTARSAPHAIRGKTKPKRAAGTRMPGSARSRSGFSDQEWHDMVSTAAYFRAEARGFEAGSAEDDWYEAEAELREQLARSEEGTESVSDSGAGPSDIEREGE